MSSIKCRAGIQRGTFLDTTPPMQHLLSGKCKVQRKTGIVDKHGFIYVTSNQLGGGAAKEEPGMEANTRDGFSGTVPLI
ncbi:hypothetical protein E2C01_012141 [Portunus trituberculatus]|uniref:Uncharacterized protein n=1 Tax=Portunus trituberculatus TaxID=210409 RepID=A0A5B7DD24_PORTR|nr:hypothetical protein [Portunus trituberculatus]